MLANTLTFVAVVLSAWDTSAALTRNYGRRIVEDISVDPLPSTTNIQKSRSDSSRVDFNKPRRNLNVKEECAGNWQQCGGKNFGPQVDCCNSGYDCQESNIWYSQCRPLPKPDAGPPPPEDPGPPPPGSPPPSPPSTCNADPPCSDVLSPPRSGFTRKGELTYYGGTGNNNLGGHCTSNWKPSNGEWAYVAMNNKDYNRGRACGTCLRACFTNTELGNGERCFNAIVNDECPECKCGDLDLGESGSGRYPVDWEVIPCPNDGPFPIKTQGSNPYYLKVKVEGGKSGIAEMKCGDRQGQPTPDGYFVFQDGSGSLGCGLECTVTYVDCGSSEEVSVPPLPGENCN